MANNMSGAPIWVVVFFVASFLYSIAFITRPAKQAALNLGMSPGKSKNIQEGIFGFYILYLGYVSALALKGVFDVNSIPPKVIVWAGLPLALFLFVWMGNTRLFKQLLRSVTLESLIAVHVFRVLGVFFIVLYFYHLLPCAFAFSAGLGDILTALFAIPVARMVSKEKPLRMTAVYIWNIFGMFDIINLLLIALVIAKNTIDTGADGNLREVTVFPFVWFPAFAPATILFLHAMIFRKLYHEKKSAKYFDTKPVC